MLHLRQTGTMTTTGKHINVHFFSTVDMKKVREVLPPNHCIRGFNETLPKKLQEVGDYFVAMLSRFCGKKKREKACMVRLLLFPVLEDGTKVNRSVECFLYGPYCEVLEENLLTALDDQGTWSADRANKDGKVVWLVLHRALVTACRKPKKSLHPLSIVVGPGVSPNCQMWLLLGSASTEPDNSNDSTPSPSLIDPASPRTSPAQWLRSTSPPPATVITSDVKTSNSELASSALSKKSTATQDHSFSVKLNPVVKNKETATTANTRKHINTRFFNTINMKKVRELLPPNHRIREFDVTVSQGMQEVGDYFVTMLSRFCGKKKQGQTCMVRLVLFPVLEDGTKVDRSLEKSFVCYLYGPYCEVLEENLSTALDDRGTWSTDKANKEGKVVWLVLHRAFVIPDRERWKGVHPLSIVVGPGVSPNCQMWLLMGTASAEPVTRRDSTPSPSPADRVPSRTSPVLWIQSPSPSPPPPPSPPPRPTTVIASDVQTSSSASASALSKRPTGSTQASLTYTKHTTTLSSAPDINGQPKPSPTARSSRHAIAPATSVGAKKIRIEYRLNPLSAGVEDCKFSTAGVLLEVVKLGEVTKTDKIYDILKVSDDSLVDPASSQNHMMVKVFHNDGVAWPEGKQLEIGQVLVFKDMMCKLYKGCLEGIVYTTKMVCICFKDEDDNLVWHSHSIKCPHNIEHAEKVAQQLFDWWSQTGSTINFGQHHVNPSTRAAAVLPTSNIANAGGKGRFTLKCLLVKKTLYPSRAKPRAVLRVCDGTGSQYQFEEITYNPAVEVDKSQLVFGSKGSLEVDIVVECSRIPPELENLQVDSFVELRGVDCVLMPYGYRRLIFTLTEEDDQVKVLEDDDDPELRSLKNQVYQAHAAKEADLAEHCHELFFEDSEDIDDVDRLTTRGSPAPHNVTPSPQPDLHVDSFEMFLRENGSIRKPPSERDSPVSKRRRLNFSSSGVVPFQALFPYQPTPQSSTHSQSPHSSPQPHTSTHPSSPQSSPLRQAIHATSPQPSTSRQPHHPSSPRPFPPPPTKVPSTRQPQQHTAQQVPTHTSSSTSTHKSALEEVQQAGSAADTAVPGAALHRTTQLKLQTEVMGEAKESSLETFYFKGKVGEVHRVQVAIADIIVIAGEDCWCGDADHACLHQWVWGLCVQCHSMFRSAHFAKFYSPFALNSMNYLQCNNCIHEHAAHNKAQPVVGEVGEKQPQGAATQFLAAVVKPFIRIKVEVANLSSHFHLTPWLTADDAALFFGVKPSFKWIIKKEKQLQETVAALLEQNSSSLTLGLVKRQVKGRINLHIVNTYLLSNPPHSRPLPPKPPNPPASPVNPQLGISPLP